MAKKSKKFPFEEMQHKATSLLSNAGAMLKLLEELKEKLAKNSHVFKTVNAELQVAQRMVKAAVTGRYTTLPWKTLVMIVGTIFYVVNPLDLMPDFLLGGLLDDLSLVTYVLARMKGDLDTFRSWEEQQK